MGTVNTNDLLGKIVVFSQESINPSRKGEKIKVKGTNKNPRMWAALVVQFNEVPAIQCKQDLPFLISKCQYFFV